MRGVGTGRKYMGSITIDDAVFVIDSGRAKQMLFNETKQMRRLVDVWISQAEARQRAGRAGRVRPGYVFKLYTKHRAMVRIISTARQQGRKAGRE